MEIAALLELFNERPASWRVVTIQHCGGDMPDFHGDRPATQEDFGEDVNDQDHDRNVAERLDEFLADQRKQTCGHSLSNPFFEAQGREQDQASRIRSHEPHGRRDAGKILPFEGERA